MFPPEMGHQLSNDLKHKKKRYSAGPGWVAPTLTATDHG